MLVDLGYFCLVLSFALGVYAILALSIGCKINAAGFVESGRKASWAIAGLVVTSYLILIQAFVNDDFSVRFVAQNSSTDLPLFYKISGAWGGMEGSLLLWGMILALFIALCAYQEQQKKPILPQSLAVANFILLFFLLLLISYSDPFARQIPIVAEGQGLNPVLQDPAMVIHPPLLYLGFIGLSIPFSMAMGSLLAGRQDNLWITASRSWLLLAWLFLTAGMIIGGQWAYYELGWGGYWAWDPVENASLLPWLTATALLHSTLAQEKRQTLKIWNLVLMILTFSLTILGTFLTRSGILNSVHSFAESSIGSAFLLFLALELVLCFGLLVYRLPKLQSSYRTYGIICKENAFLINNLLFLSLAFIVLYGTVFPLIAEGLAGRRISIQAPFFNQVTAPLVIVLVLLMGIAPTLAWKKANLTRVRSRLSLPFLVTICLVALMRWWTDEWAAILLVSAVYFSIHVISLELKIVTQFTRRRLAQQPDNKKLIKRQSMRWYGGMLVHLAVLVTMVGVVGNLWSLEESVRLKPQEQTSIGGYTLIYEQPAFFQVRNAEHRAAVIRVVKDGQTVKILQPAKAFYPTSDEPTSEAAIYRRWFEDLYLNLITLNTDQSINLIVYLNRLVWFIPLSLVLAALGILLCANCFRPLNKH